MREFDINLSQIRFFQDRFAFKWLSIELEFKGKISFVPSLTIFRLQTELLWTVINHLSNPYLTFSSCSTIQKWCFMWKRKCCLQIIWNLFSNQGLFWSPLRLPGLILECICKSSDAQCWLTLDGWKKCNVIYERPQREGSNHFNIFLTVNAIVPTKCWKPFHFATHDENCVRYSLLEECKLKREDYFLSFRFFASNGIERFELIRVVFYSTYTVPVT